MPFLVSPAAPHHARELVEIQVAASWVLTSRYGYGPWSWGATESTVLANMKRATVYIARQEGVALGTFALSARKPWAIDSTHFSPGRKPLYLTAMAVHPSAQRRGIGRFCIEEARRLAAEWPADAIRLDAWDAAPGAGGFYLKCGFRETGRAVYRRTPLIYFELLL